MNVWNGIGRVGKDPEVNYTQGNYPVAVARFNLGINRGKDKDGNDKGTDWIRCVAFGKTAEVIEKYVGKGDQLGVQGHIQTGSYEDRQTGEKKYTTDIVVDRMDFGQKAKNNGQEQRTEYRREAETHEDVQQAEQVGFEAIDEEVPF